MNEEKIGSFLISGFLATNKGIEDKVITSEELEDKLSGFITHFTTSIAPLLNLSVSEQAIQNFRDEMRRRVSLEFTAGATLSDGKYEPWVDQCWETNDQYYWKRYRTLLERNEWPTKVIRDIGKVTDDILDQCGNPQATSYPWQKRGLVIGDVQSGKTSVFTGLINKAADAGYRVIIVLTGMLESLRVQTQDRLDREFVGHSSREDKVTKETKVIGVGLINPLRSPSSFTSIYMDFNKQIRSTSNVSLASINEPVLLVIKKNVSVLKSVKKWLKEKNLQGQYVEHPLFLIDDEADNASVNTNKDDEDPTKVNAEIRNLLALFKNASYVGFTATPFANVFINPDEIGEHSEDLFPSNFIRTTNIPSNYFGVQKMLGEQGLDDDISYEDSPYLCQITDAEEPLPLKHKKEHAVAGLWPSLQEAVRQYLLANAIMDLRQSKQLHRSMMINVSRFTQIQNNIAEKVEDYLEELLRDIEVHGASPQADKNPTISMLRDTYCENYADCSGFEWEEVRNSLYRSNKSVKVFVVNTSRESKRNRLDYDGNKHGLRAIVIGGLAIARGVTLEGLCISYLYRSTAYYDTLMQMGRWFGYRPGYEDLCRIWLSEDTANYYRQIARATEELKAEVDIMSEARLSPKDFGLKVRESPDALLITSRNKMRTGQDIVLRTSYSSYFVETAQLKKSSNEENIKCTQKLVRQIKERGIEEEQTDFKGRRMFRNVPKELIADYIEKFEVHPRCYQLSHYDENELGMAHFVRNTAIKCLQEWDVVFEQRRSASDESEIIDLGLDAPLNCIRRCVSDIDSWKKGDLFFDRNRVATSDLEAATLSREEFEELGTKHSEERKEKTMIHRLRLKYRNSRERPLLIVMPVCVYEQREQKELRFSDESRLDDSQYLAYALSFCNFGESSRQTEEKVSYKVNKTWFREHIEYEFDSEEDEE